MTDSRNAEDRVEIVEVGPRDGLQIIDTFIDTATKIEFINLLLVAGFKRIELGSFVSPKAVPQMADIDAVVKGLPSLGAACGMVLVPNSQGVRRAVAAGIRDMVFVISMTDSHNRSNVRRTTAESIADFRSIIENLDASDAVRIRVGLATSFHCPFEGTVPEAVVLNKIEALLQIQDGTEFVLADTTGFALPSHVGNLTRTAIKHFGQVSAFGLHLHDTAGFAVANTLAALDSGIRSFDASAAGLGGCPFAPGATGNVASEDLVYLFDRLGIHTGVDLGALLKAADFAASLPGGKTGGHARILPRKKASLAGV